MSNDTDPAFMAEFYTNIKILNQDLYKKTTVAPPGIGPRPATSIHRPMSSADASKPSSRMLNRSDSKRNLSRGDSHRNLGTVSNQTRSSAHLLTQESRGSPPGEYFTAQHMQERVRQYAEEAGIPVDYLERYSQEAKSTASQGKSVGGVGTTESLKRMMVEE